MTRPLRRTAIALLAASLPLAGSADVTTETVHGLEIERASAAPADAGGTTRLGFRLFNNTAETIWVTGLASSLAVEGALLYRSYHGEEARVAAMVLKPGETIDFTTSHLVARLEGLEADLRPGDAAPFEITLRLGSVAGEADVH